MPNSGNEALHARVSVLEDQMERLLGNGQPGFLAELESEVKDVQHDVSSIQQSVQKARYQFLVGLCIVVTAVIAAGSGTISLKTFIELITK
jgi:hypothetical protein